jgi:hypothetical protein
MMIQQFSLLNLICERLLAHSSLVPYRVFSSGVAFVGLHIREIMVFIVCQRSIATLIYLG